MITISTDRQPHLLRAAWTLVAQGRARITKRRRLWHLPGAPTVVDVLLTERGRREAETVS